MTNKVLISTGKYTVSLPTGEYVKDGQTKKTYSNVWALRIKEDGKISLKFDDIVANYLKPIMGKNFGWFMNVQLFNDNQQTNAPASSHAPSTDGTDELPF